MSEESLAPHLALRPLVAAVWSVVGHLRERHRVAWHVVAEESRVRGEPTLPYRRAG